MAHDDATGAALAGPRPSPGEPQIEQDEARITTAALALADFDIQTLHNVQAMARESARLLASVIAMLTSTAVSLGGARAGMTPVLNLAASPSVDFAPQPQRAQSVAGESATPVGTAELAHAGSAQPAWRPLSDHAAELRVPPGPGQSAPQTASALRAQIHEGLTDGQAGGPSTRWAPPAQPAAAIPETVAVAPPSRGPDREIVRAPDVPSAQLSATLFATLSGTQSARQPAIRAAGFPPAPRQIAPAPIPHPPVHPPTLSGLAHGSADVTAGGLPHAPPSALPYQSVRAPGLLLDRHVPLSAFERGTSPAGAPAPSRDSGGPDMLGIDQTGPLTRPAMPDLEILPVRVAIPAARELGLRDGEVVQALVEVDASTTRLVLRGFGIDVPNPHGYQAGDTPTFRVRQQADGMVLLALPQAGSIAPPPQTAAGAPGPAAPATLLALLMRPPAASALAGLLEGGRLANLLGSSLPALAALVRARLPTLSKIDAAMVRQAVRNSGLWGEAQMARGEAPAPDDLKQIIAQIRDAAGQEAPARVSADQALEDLSAMQLRAVQAQAHQELLLNLMIPFADAPPVRLTFHRHAATREQPDPPYTIDMHSRSDALGEVWFRGRIAGKTGIDIVMWAVEPRVAEAANRASRTLGRELETAGLRMTSFVVYNTARDDERPEATPPGSIINLKA